MSVERGQSRRGGGGEGWNGDSVKEKGRWKRDVDREGKVLNMLQLEEEEMEKRVYRRREE
jgi:hypothetical protein